MTRIVLYNPHVDDFFAEPVHFRLFKRRPLKKYGFFIDSEIKQFGDVKVLVDGSLSSFIPVQYFTKLPQSIRCFVSWLEFSIWKKINNLGHNVIRVYNDNSTASQDIVLAFSYKSAVGEFGLRKDLFSKYKAVVFHLSHYFVATAEKSKNIAQLDNVWLAGDADISENTYFKHFFPWYSREIIVLPFYVADRFKTKLEFGQRKNICVATGSFHDLRQERPIEKYTDYMSVTGFSTYHPLRKEIYEKRVELSNQIECRVSPYRSLEKTSMLVKFLRHFSVSQKAYFAIDIVELYNQPKFAVISEEVPGFPAIGVFEAMACGCVVFCNPIAYKGLSLVEWVHYVPYDGTLIDLLNKIEHMIGNSKQANLISEETVKYVLQNMTADNMYKFWFKNLNVVGK